MSNSFIKWFIALKSMNKLEEKWVLCPACGSKTRLRLFRRTILRNFPLFCPKCKQERIINVENYQVEVISQSEI